MTAAAARAELVAFGDLVIAVAFERNAQRCDDHLRTLPIAGPLGALGGQAHMRGRAVHVMPRHRADDCILRLRW